MTETSNSKILYVDDEQENLDGFRFTFRREYNILTAKSAEEALVLLEDHPDIKVIISDQRMPNMKGTEFFIKVAEKKPNIIRIILTAFTDAEAIMEAINKGEVYRFLTKPWNRNELKITITNALETFELKTENHKLLNDLKSANEKLKDINQNLEKLVEERTIELKETNDNLESTNEELATTNEELNSAVKELNLINNQLTNEITQRKKAQKELKKYKNHLEDIVEQRTEELKKTEFRLSTLSNNLPGGAIFRGIVSRDKKYKMDYVSKQFYEILSINDAKIEQKNKNQDLFSLIHPDDLPELSKRLKYSISKLKVLDVEMRYLVSEKKTIWLNVKSLPHVDKNKNIIFDGFIIDVTERKKAEKALHESETRYRELFEQAADGILVGKHPGTIIDANSSICSISEYSRDEITGKNISLFFSDETLKNNPLQYDLIDKGITVTNERNLLTKFGVEIPIEMNTKKLNDGRLQSFIRDISERVEAQKTIKNNEQKFRNLFNSSADGIIISDFKNGMLEVNEQALVITGMNKTEIFQLEFDEIVSPSFKKQITFRLEKIKNQGEISSEEFEIMRKDGSVCPVELNSKAIEYEGGKAVLNMVHDITERKLMDRKLLDAIIQTEEKERSLLARNLHDDLGPLLSSIKMYANSLSEIKDKKKLIYIVQQINEIVKEAIQATKDVSNDLSPHILVNYGLQSAISSYLTKAEEKFKIDFECELEQKRYNENIETNFYRIVKELVNNTVKHANATEIKIELKQKLHQMTLSYQDNGKNYNPENIESKGMGLFNISNRINSLNGKSRIYKTDSGGFGCDILINLK